MVMTVIRLPTGIVMSESCDCHRFVAEQLLPSACEMLRRESTPLPSHCVTMGRGDNRLTRTRLSRDTSSGAFRYCDSHVAFDSAPCVFQKGS
jgi:hypothetical protein